MTERPILFSGPMIRAIIEGRKTQTRRVILPQPPPKVTFAGQLRTGEFNYDYQTFCWCLGDAGDIEDWTPAGLPWFRCPNGQIGDRLWVKENFRLRADQDHKPPSEDWWKSGAWYQADGNCEPSGCGGGAGKLRPSIFMPRWASRILLELEQVRTERLQAISEKDAQAEGVHPYVVVGNEPWYPEGYRASYRLLWDSLNAKRGFGWEANPWTWALTFKVLEVKK